jgi:quercetin dioxygenase-like cupin family protein
MDELLKGPVSQWDIAALQGEVLGALQAMSTSGDAQLVDGRAIAVKASPERGNSTHLAVGVAALPPAYTTVPHTHEAEEVAIVLSGSGAIEIVGVEHPVKAGDVVLTPPNAPHRTRADASSALVLLWVYAPAGSERRWMQAE